MMVLSAVGCFLSDGSRVVAQAQGTGIGSTGHEFYDGREERKLLQAILGR